MTPNHFLFVMLEGGGTVPPQLGLARQLIQRGHTVQVLGDPSIADDAQVAGCTFTPYVRAPHRIDRRPETALIRDWEIRNPLALFAHARAYLFDKALAFAEDVLAVLDRQPADVLAIDKVIDALGALPVLRAVIRRVLDEPSFRLNARRLGAAIAEETRRSLAIAELEGLAAS